MGLRAGSGPLGSVKLTPKPSLAGPRFQAVARGCLLRPSRALPVVLAGCVCELILYPTTTATGTHDSTLSGRTANRRALMKDTERPVRRALKGVRGTSYESRQRNIYSEQVGSHSWSMPSTSSCQKVRFVELRPVSAFQIARAHHIGSAAYADGALSVSIPRSISMIRGQGSEAWHHGTPVHAE